MKSPDQIRELLTRRYEMYHRSWLATCGQWPLEVPLGTPTEQQASRQLEAVASWTASWRSCRGPGNVDWVERKWAKLGTHALPWKLSLHSPEEVAEWAGQLRRWQKARKRYQEMVQNCSALVEALPRHFDVLADYEETDFRRLQSFLSWIRAHPDSRLYVRQLPIEGLDTKWIESRKTVIATLVAALRGDRKAEDGFFKCCGLRQPPHLIRLKLLDPLLRSRTGGLGDFYASVDDIAALDVQPLILYIVENLQTGLAFEDLPGSAVLMHLGYDVGILGQIPWISCCRCVYWGDIDTHGFAMLSLARSAIPHLESILMDEDTALSHRELWVTEKEPHAATELRHLTRSEQLVYSHLKQQHWGCNVRLEQERISWDFAWRRIEDDRNDQAP